MKEDCKIRNGYRVIGNNTADGRISVWYYPDKEHADLFAQSLAESTGKEVDVVKYLGSWRTTKPPCEFIKSED